MFTIKKYIKNKLKLKLSVGVITNTLFSVGDNTNREQNANNFILYVISLNYSNGV